MNNKHKMRIHRLNHLLNKPITVIIILLLMFVYFGYRNAQFQKENRTIIEQTNTSATNSEVIVGQLKKVLCESIPQKDCNLSQAVAQLKTNNDEQTILLCKLFLSNDNRLSGDDIAQVEAICKERIKTLTPTSASGTSSTNGASKPASTPSSSGSPGASSPPQSGSNNGNGQTNNPPPKLLNCDIDLLGLHLGCP